MTPGESTFWRMEAERNAVACRLCADTDAGLVCRADLGGQCGKETGRWPEDDPDEDPVLWEQDRAAERHQSHLDRVHGGSDCDCVF